GEQQAQFGGVVAQFADSAYRVIPGFAVAHWILMAFDGPEPQLFALCRGQGLVQAEGDDFTAQLGGGFQGAVAVGQILFPVLRIDDTATDSRNGWCPDTGCLRGGLELVQALGAQVARSDPAVEEINVGEAGFAYFGEHVQPYRGIGVLDGASGA